MGRKRRQARLRGHRAGHQRPEATGEGARGRTRLPDHGGIPDAGHVFRQGCAHARISADQRIRRTHHRAPGERGDRQDRRGAVSGFRAGLHGSRHARAQCRRSLDLRERIRARRWSAIDTQDYQGGDLRRQPVGSLYPRRIGRRDAHPPGRGRGAPPRAARCADRIGQRSQPDQPHPRTDRFEDRICDAQHRSGSLQVYQRPVRSRCRGRGADPVCPAPACCDRRSRLPRQNRWQ